jgi:hypothetical protein
MRAGLALAALLAAAAPAASEWGVAKPAPSGSAVPAAAARASPVLTVLDANSAEPEGTKTDAAILRGVGAASSQHAARALATTDSVISAGNPSPCVLSDNAYLVPVWFTRASASSTLNPYVAVNVTASTVRLSSGSADASLLSSVLAEPVSRLVWWGTFGFLQRDTSTKDMTVALKFPVLSGPLFAAGGSLAAEPYIDLVLDVTPVDDTCTASAPQITIRIARAFGAPACPMPTNGDNTAGLVSNDLVVIEDYAPQLALVFTRSAPSSAAASATLQVQLYANTGSLPLLPGGAFDFMRLGIIMPAGATGVLSVLYTSPTNLFLTVNTADSSVRLTGTMLPLRSYSGNRPSTVGFNLTAYRRDFDMRNIPTPSYVLPYGASPNYFSVAPTVDPNTRCAPFVLIANTSNAGASASTALTFVVTRNVVATGFVGGISVRVRFTPDADLPVGVFRFPADSVPLFWGDGDYQPHQVRVFVNENPWQGGLLANETNTTSACGTLTLESPLGVDLAASSAVYSEGLDIWKRRIRICLASSAGVASSINFDERQLSAYGASCALPSPSPTPSVTPSASPTPSNTPSGTGTPAASFIPPTPTPTPSTTVPSGNLKVTNVLRQVSTTFAFTIGTQPVARPTAGGSRTRVAATVQVPPELLAAIAADASYVPDRDISDLFADWAGVQRGSFFFDGLVNGNASAPALVRAATFVDAASDIYLFPDIFVREPDPLGLNRSQVYRGVPAPGTECHALSGFVLSSVSVSVCPVSFKYTLLGFPLTVGTGVQRTAGSYSLSSPHVVSVAQRPADGLGADGAGAGAARIRRGVLFPGFVYAVLPDVSAVAGFTLAGVDSVSRFTSNSSTSLALLKGRPSLLYVNAPPTAGSLAVSPPSGTALSTVFTATTSGWTDDGPATLRPAGVTAANLDFELRAAHPFPALPSSGAVTLEALRAASYCADNLVTPTSPDPLNPAVLSASYWSSFLNAVSSGLGITRTSLCLSLLTRARQFRVPDDAPGTALTVSYRTLSGGDPFVVFSPSSDPAGAATQGAALAFSQSWAGVPLGNSTSSLTLQSPLPSGPAASAFSTAVYAFVSDEDGGVGVASASATVAKATVPAGGAAALSSLTSSVLSNLGAAVSDPAVLALALGDLTDVLVNASSSSSGPVNASQTAALAAAKSAVVSAISSSLTTLLAAGPSADGSPVVGDTVADVLAASLLGMTAEPTQTLPSAANTALSAVSNLMRLLSPTVGADGRIPPASRLPDSVALSALSVVSNVLSSELSADPNATARSSGGASQFRDGAQAAASALSTALLRDATAGSAPRTVVAASSTNATIDPISGCAPALAITVARLDGTSSSSSVAAAAAPCGGAPAELQPGPVSPSVALDVSSLLADAGSNAGSLDLQVLTFSSSPVAEKGDWGKLNKPGSFGASARRRQLLTSSGPSGSAGQSIDLNPSAGLDSNVVAVTLQTSTGAPVDVKASSRPIRIKIPSRPGTNATGRAAALAAYDPPSFSLVCPAVSEDFSSILSPGTRINSTRFFASGAGQPSAYNATVLRYTNTTYTAPVYWKTTGSKDKLPTVFGTGSNRVKRDPTGKITGYRTVTVPVYTIEVDCGGTVGAATFSCGSDPKAEMPPQNVTFSCPETRIKPTCAFYNETLNTWSDNGCVVDEVTDDYIVCACTHLTEFAARFSALADQQRDMFAMNDLLSDPDVLNQYPNVFITIGTIGGSILILTFVTLYLDHVGDRRYYKLLTLDEEVATLRTIEQAKGHAFILDRAIDASFAKLTPLQQATFGSVGTAAQARSATSGSMLTSLGRGQDVAGLAASAATKGPAAASAAGAPGDVAVTVAVDPAQAAADRIMDISKGAARDPYATALYLKVVDAFDAQRVSLSVLQKDVATAAQEKAALTVGATATLAEEVVDATPGGAASPTASSMQNPMHAGAAGTAALTPKAGTAAAASGGGKPVVDPLAKARSKLAKLSDASTWSCVRVWRLRNFIFRTWATMVWVDHEYFAVFTRHDARSSRTQRLLILTCNLLTNLFACAFWYAFRNDGGENPDLPEMEVTELLVVAGLSTALQLPINIVVDELMSAAGEANFTFRYPFLAAELSRRKRMQARLARLSRPLLEAEVAKFQFRLDNIHGAPGSRRHHHNHNHHHNHKAAGGSAADSTGTPHQHHAHAHDAAHPHPHTHHHHHHHHHHAGSAEALLAGVLQPPTVAAAAAAAAPVSPPPAELIDPTTPGGTAYAEVVRMMASRYHPGQKGSGGAEEEADGAPGMSLFMAARAVQAFKKADERAEERVKTRKIAEEEDPIESNEDFDYGWVDAPPGLRAACPWVLKCLGRHPKQKEAFVAKKREGEQRRLEKYKALAEARAQARDQIIKERDARRAKRLAKAGGAAAGGQAAAAAPHPAVKGAAAGAGKSSLLLALKAAAGPASPAALGGVQPLPPKEIGVEPSPAAGGGEEQIDGAPASPGEGPGGFKRRVNLKIASKHMTTWHMKKKEEEEARAAAMRAAAGEVEEDKGSSAAAADIPAPAAAASAGPAGSLPRPPHPPPVSAPSVGNAALVMAGGAAAAAAATLPLPESRATDGSGGAGETGSVSGSSSGSDSDSDSGSDSNDDDFDLSSSEEEEDEEDGGDEVEAAGFIEEMLAAGDTGERLMILLSTAFDLIKYLACCCVALVIKPPPPKTPEEALEATLQKYRDRKEEKKAFNKQLKQLTSTRNIDTSDKDGRRKKHKGHAAAALSGALKTMAEKHAAAKAKAKRDDDPSDNYRCGFTCEGITAYAATLAWMGFCLYYILLFGLYQGDEATQSFISGWGVSQAFTSFVLAPSVFLLALIWQYAIWPTWLPYLIWLPVIGRTLASREARAMTAADGSATLSGRMEHLTLVRAAGYASMLSPQTAIVAYGASAAVAAAYSGVASSINKIRERQAAKKAQLKGRSGVAAYKEQKVNEELTAQQRNELIIRRYLLEQVIVVERARHQLKLEKKFAAAQQLEAGQTRRLLQLEALSTRAAGTGAGTGAARPPAQAVVVAQS